MTDPPPQPIPDDYQKQRWKEAERAFDNRAQNRKFHAESVDRFALLTIRSVQLSAAGGIVAVLGFYGTHYDTFAKVPEKTSSVTQIMLWLFGSLLATMLAAGAADLLRRGDRCAKGELRLPVCGDDADSDEGQFDRRGVEDGRDRVDDYCGRPSSGRRVPDPIVPQLNPRGAPPGALWSAPLLRGGLLHEIALCAKRAGGDMQSLADFTSNLTDFDRLVEIHTNEGGGGKGRKHRLEVLNKASIVLLTAFWEAFCEDTVSEAVAHLVAHAPDHKSLPLAMQKAIAAEVKKSLNELEPWTLSGDGWRQYLLARLETIKDARDFAWNSPKAGSVDDFFKDALAIARISDSWKYAKKVTPVWARKTLNDFVSLRGNIAHRGANDKPVLKAQCTQYATLLKGIAGRSAATVEAHLLSITNVAVP